MSKIDNDALIAAFMANPALVAGLLAKVEATQPKVKGRKVKAKAVSQTLSDHYWLDKKTGKRVVITKSLHRGLTVAQPYVDKNGVDQVAGVRVKDRRTVKVAGKALELIEYRGQYGRYLTYEITGSRTVTLDGGAQVEEIEMAGFKKSFDKVDFSGVKALPVTTVKKAKGRKAG